MALLSWSRTMRPGLMSSCRCHEFLEIPNNPIIGKPSGKKEPKSFLINFPIGSEPARSAIGSERSPQVSWSFLHD